MPQRFESEQDVLDEFDRRVEAITFDEHGNPSENIGDITKELGLRLEFKEQVDEQVDDLRRTLDSPTA